MSTCLNTTTQAAARKRDMSPSLHIKTVTYVSRMELCAQRGSFCRQVTSCLLGIHRACAFKDISCWGQYRMRIFLKRQDWQICSTRHSLHRQLTHINCNMSGAQKLSLQITHAIYPWHLGRPSCFCTFRQGIMS